MKQKGGSQASQNRGGVRSKSDPAGAGNRVGGGRETKMDFLSNGE